MPFQDTGIWECRPPEHPRLVQLADDFAKVLQNVPGTLVATNTLADMLRMNLNVQFWFWRWILDKGLRYIKRNLSACGVHSSMPIDQDHPVDITDYALIHLA